MERKVNGVEIFMLLGPAMLGISVVVHEIGHAVACAAQGFDILEINLLYSYVKCSVSNQIVWIMGGCLASLVMLPLLYVKRIRRFLPALLSFVTAALTQFLLMLLEGFLNPMYREHNLENYALMFGLAMISAFVVYYRSKLKEWYLIKIEKTDPPKSWNRKLK